MKCSELQIGDYVRFKHTKEVVGVFEIDDDRNVINNEPDGYCSEKNIAIDDVEPIPLTKDILEKSSFYFGYTSDEEDLASNTIAQLSEEDKGWVLDEGDGSIKVILPNESDGGMIIIDDQSFDRRLSLVYNNEVYVHELQHLLKLVGINKEIIL